MSDENQDNAPASPPESGDATDAVVARVMGRIGEELDRRFGGVNEKFDRKLAAFKKGDQPSESATQVAHAGEPPVPKVSFGAEHLPDLLAIGAVREKLPQPARERLDGVLTQLGPAAGRAIAEILLSIPAASAPESGATATVPKPGARAAAPSTQTVQYPKTQSEYYSIIKSAGDRRAQADLEARYRADPGFDFDRLPKW